MNHEPEDYKRERVLRGTQESVAKQLGIHPQTVAKRERGALDAPITQEAWLALVSLPKTRKRRRPANGPDVGRAGNPQPKQDLSYGY